MATSKKAIFNWSGGKDSSLALFEILQNREFEISTLFTTVNKQYQRISMHGVRVELLEQQAQSIGLPLFQLQLSEMPSMEEYDKMLFGTMQEFKKQGIEYSIFGDIFLEDLKHYREQQLARVNMQAVFPLWQRDTTALIKEFIAKGFKAVIVCVNEKYLNKSFSGRLIDEEFVRDLPADVDPCGENGEYHSFVFDGPIFKKPVKFERGEVVYRKYKSLAGKPEYENGFFFCDLLPVN